MSSLPPVDEKVSDSYHTQPLSDVAKSLDEIVEIAAILQTRCLQGWERTTSKGSIRWSHGPAATSVVLFATRNGFGNAQVIHSTSPLALGMELTKFDDACRMAIRQALDDAFDNLYLHPGSHPGKIHLAPDHTEHRYDVVLLPEDPQQFAKLLDDFMQDLPPSVRHICTLNGFWPCASLLDEVRSQTRHDLRGVSEPGFPACQVESAYAICTKGDSVEPASLKGPPPAWLSGSCTSMQANFSVGQTSLPVTCNVFEVSRQDLHLLQTEKLIQRLGLSGIQSKAEKHVRAARQHIDHNCPEECSCMGLVDSLEEQAQRIAQFNRGSMDQLTECLEQWDAMSRELQDCVRNHCESPCPIHTFLRDGLFHPGQIQVGNKQFPPGCYIDATLSGQEKDLTQFHELAHAAMAVNRQKGAITGCRWMEEGFAEFLMGAKLGNPLGRCRESWCELDVYMSWAYIDSLPRNEVEDLLRRWLQPADPRDFCEDVRQLRRFIAN